MLRVLTSGRSTSASRLAAVRNPPTCHCSEVSLVPSRKYSYYKSRTEESPDKYTKFEKSFKEWKFVEKLMPPDHVPTPPTDPHVDLPSGWRPPNPPKDCSYFVRRTKNHLMPVYEQIMLRGMARWTHICKVEGNIWQLEKDIGEYLQKYVRTNMPVIIRTHELSRQVIIKGNHVDAVKEWLTAKGF